MTDIADQRRPNMVAILVNYNAIDDVARLATSLSPHMRVVIANNDLSARDSPAWNDMPATVTHAEANGGFAAGVNLAIEHADPEATIVLCNPDVQVDPAVLVELCQLADAGPFDIVTPTIIRPDGMVWYQGGSFNSMLMAIRHDGYGGRPQSGLERLVSTHFVSGCILAISSRARADLFPLRAELFMYWEDIELSFRARERGWRMGVAYDLVAVHDEGGSSAVGRGRSALFHYFQSRNRLIVLADRGYSPVKLFAASIPYSVSALVSIVRTDEHAWRNAKSLVRGTMKGIGYVIAKHRVLRRLATHA